MNTEVDYLMNVLSDATLVTDCPYCPSTAGYRCLSMPSGAIKSAPHVSRRIKFLREYHEAWQNVSGMSGE